MKLMAIVVVVFIWIGLANANSSVTFPKSFDWCVATSAHQVEGQNIYSDWWDFELTPGNVINSHRSGWATDHWNRLEEDTQLIGDLGVKTYRFSIEWAKIEPKEGQFSLRALNHYKRELQILRKNGIRPMVTLHHFTLPKWFAKKGGWTSINAPKHFERFVQVVDKHIGKQVGQWVTINEPLVVLLGGYMTGEIPPQKKNDKKGLKQALLGMLKSHVLAYHYLHKKARMRGQAIKVGIAKHMRVFQGHRLWNPLDYFAAKVSARAFNWSFLNALQTGTFKFWVPGVGRLKTKIQNMKGTMDFIGINYYSRDKVSLHPFSKQKIKLNVEKRSDKTDMGWEIYPQGVFQLLVKTKNKYAKMPIYITENGIADASDDKRIRFIRLHLKWVYRAMEKGVPVRGYCHWSLLDNFEWQNGFVPRFGLYHVDYRTFERTIRKSGVYYSQLTRSGTLK